MLLGSSGPYPWLIWKRENGRLNDDDVFDGSCYSSNDLYDEEPPNRSDYIPEDFEGYNKHGDDNFSKYKSSSARGGYSDRSPGERKGKTFGKSDGDQHSRRSPDGSDVVKGYIYRWIFII